MNIEPVALTNRQRRVLAEMGIDVWVRRGVAATPMAAAGPVVEVKRSRQHAEPPLPIVSERPQTASTTPELRVSLDCIAAIGIVVVGEFANPLDQRFAQDVLLAIAGMDAKPQKAQFRWPQTQTGDSSLGAARNAYRGFLRGQIERANARWLLLLGAHAASLLNPDAKLEPETLKLPDVRALRADPNAKRQLWLSVSQRIPA
jgi:hypothetical protein